MNNNFNKYSKSILDKIPKFIKENKLMSSFLKIIGLSFDRIGIKIDILRNQDL